MSLGAEEDGGKEVVRAFRQPFPQLGYRSVEARDTVFELELKVFDRSIGGVGVWQERGNGRARDEKFGVGDSLASLATFKIQLSGGESVSCRVKEVHHSSGLGGEYSPERVMVCPVVSHQFSCPKQVPAPNAQFGAE